jgi:DNA repair exonuclease SbcCD ATPase subunit
MIPLSLKLRNFFSHADSEIDFSGFQSVLLIGNTEGDYGKSNGSGKSSIFESMLWVLFNKARPAMMDDIVLWGETNCCVEFEFQHNNRIYRVIRDRNRGSSTSTVELALKDDTGAWTDLSGSTSGATNKSIEELIGLDHKTFTSSIYFRQNDISEFAEADPSRKKDILKSIVDISRWDIYEGAAKKKARILRSESDILEAEVSTYAESVENLGDAGAELKDVTTTVADAKKELSSTNRHLEGLVSQYSTMKKALDTDQYDKILESIAALEERETDLSGDVNELQQQVEAKRDETDAEFKSIEEKKVSLSQMSKVENCDDKLSELREELILLSSSGSSAKDALESMSEIHITPGECYVCNQSIESSLYETLRDSHKEKSNQYSEAMIRAASKIRIIKKSISEYEEYNRENLKIDSIEKELSSIEFRHSILSEGLEREEKKLTDLRRVFGDVSSKLSINKDILKSLQNSDFQVLRDKIKKLKDRREDLDSVISGSSEDVGRLTERVSQLEESVKEMKGKKASLSSKLKDISLFKSMSKMMGKNGIQTILLDGIIEDLESSSNKILSSICNEPSTITLETQRTGSDGVSTVETLDLKVKKDGVLHGFKSLSGGEKFRISLSLRVALSDLSSRYGGSSLEFLLLDEVNSPLDRFGVETLFVSVIRALEAQYKIMVITHDETLKEKFDHVIDVTKVNGKSSIDLLAR